MGIANGLHYLHTYEQGPIIHGGIKGVGGGYATVSSGILLQREEALIGGADSRGNSKAIKVKLCSIMLCLTSDECEPRWL